MENFRRTDEAFRRGDRDAWIECFDPDAEMVPAKEWPENAPVRGAGDIEVTQLITVLNDNIRVVEYFWDHAEALKAPGLAE